MIELIYFLCCLLKDQGDVLCDNFGYCDFSLISPYFILFSLIARPSEPLHNASILNQMVPSKSSQGKNSASISKNQVMVTIIGCTETRSGIERSSWLLSVSTLASLFFNLVSCDLTSMSAARSHVSFLGPWLSNLNLYSTHKYNLLWDLRAPSINLSCSLPPQQFFSYQDPLPPCSASLFHRPRIPTLIHTQLEPV